MVIVLKPTGRLRETEPGLRPALTYLQNNPLSNPSQFSVMQMSQDAGFPENAVFVIGAGHFGARAVKLLVSRLNSPMWVVDSDERRLERLEGKSVRTFLAEGIQFITENFNRFRPSNLIVPAVPLHLASEWLKTCSPTNLLIRNREVPAEIKPLVPFAWDGRDGDLLVSYADFRCPDDCPEPEGYCTVTRKSREMPLHRLLENIQVTGYRVHILESRQLAPGVGGYRAEDLRQIYDRVRRGGRGRWLVGTACKCHGVVTAVEVEPRGDIL
jgi:hypothetical protein